MDPEEAGAPFDPTNFILNEQRSAVASAIGSPDDDPEKAARALQIADATGDHPALVYGNLDNYEQQHKAALTAQLLNSNSYLMDYVNSHPLAAKVSADDFGQLDGVSQKLQPFYQTGPKTAGTWAGGAEAGAPASILKAAIEGGADKFNEAYGEGLGLSSLSTPEGQEFAKNNRFLAALEATFETPMHGIASVIAGGLGAVHGAITEGGKQFGLDPSHAESLASEVTGLAESEVMGLTGRGGHMDVSEANAVRAERLKQVQKLMKATQDAEPYINAGHEPPAGLNADIDKVKFEQNKLDLDNLSEALKEAQTSQTRERSPDMFATFVRQHVGEAEIGVSADAVRRIYGDKSPMTDDGLLGFVPDLAKQLEIAESTGGDVRIPMADWLAKVDPAVEKELHDDLRVRPGGITKNEVEAAKEAKAVEPEEVEPKYAGEPLPEKGLAPAIRGSDGTIYVGRSNGQHFEIFDKHFDEMNERGNETIDTQGFVNPQGDYLDRSKALDWVQKNEKPSFRPSENMQGELDALDYRDKVSLDKRVAIAGPNALDTVRKSAALEPLFSVEDRKLTLKRTPLSDTVQGLVDENFKPHDFDMLDQTGKRVGTINLTQQKGGKRLYIDMIQGGGNKTQYEPNAFGPKLMRDLLRQIKEQFPQAEEITGHRVSGAREKAGSFGEPSAEPVIKLDNPETHDIATFLKLVDDGMLKRYGQINAIVKPKELLTQREGEITKAVDTEMARVLPKQVEIQAAHEIKTQAIGGARPRGVFTSFEDRQPLILYSLFGDDPIGTARHEAIHGLRAQGFFTDNEWSSLEKAAREDDWQGKYKINSRYRNLNDEGKLEESIADAYKDWKANKETETTHGKVFQKLLDLLSAIKDKIKSIFGHDPSFDEIFQRVDSGEVGSREGNAPRNEKAFKFDTTEEEAEREAFATASAAGLNVDQFRRFKKLIDQQKAEDLEKAERRAVAEQTKRQSAEWKAESAALRPSVAESINARPDVAADNYLRTGELYGQKGEPVKLDASGLTAEQKAGLPRSFYGKDGVSADDIAGLFGYRTGDDLVARVSALAQAEKESGMRHIDFRRRMISAEVERQMEAKHGDLASNILEEAKDQATSSVQQEILHEQMLALAERAGLKFTMTKDDVADAVKKAIGETAVKNVSVDRFLADSGRAGNAIKTAFLKEDWAEAFRQSQRQNLAFRMAREAKGYERARTQFDRLAKRFSAREIKAVEPEYTNFIHDILQKLGQPIKRSIQDLQGAIAEGEAKDLKSFVEMKADQFREIPMPDFLYDPNFGKPVDELPLADFMDVKNALTSLAKQGADERKIDRAGEKADLAETLVEMREKLQTFPEKKIEDQKGPVARRLNLPRTYLANGINNETLLNRWDRNDPRGVFNSVIVRPLTDAANYKARLDREFSREFKALGKVKDPDKLITAPFNDPETGRPYQRFTRENALAILQNAGNRGNWQAMVKGFKTDSDTLMQWLHANTTKEDWDRAQAMGDIFNKAFDLSKNVYRNITGVAPEAIDIQPIATPFGEYKGWYHPIIRDAAREGSSKRLMGGEISDDGNFFRAMTSNGYTKRRSGYVAPLDLTFDAVPSKLGQILHDVAFREAIINTSKVYYDRGFRSDVQKHYGQVYRDGLVPYLKGVAGGESMNSRAAGLGRKVSEYLRQNVISTYIGFNPFTALKHGPTALILSANEVGPVNFARAVAGLYGKSEEIGLSNAEFAMAHSEELQRRERHWQDTIVGQHKNLYGDSTLRESVIEKGSWLVAQSDMLSAKPTWLAQYWKSMDEGVDHGQAVFEADRAVRRAHGSTAVTNQPALVSGGGALHGWLTSVYGFFGTMMQRRVEIAHAINDTYQLGREGEIAKAAANVPALTSAIFSYVIWPTIVEEWVTGMNTDDRRGLGTHLLTAGMAGLASSFIYIRDIVHSIATGQDPSVGLISSPYHDVANLVRDLRQGKKMLDKTHAGNLVRDTITVFGEVTGLAPKAVGNAAKFGIDVATGAQRPKGPTQVMRGVTRGVAQPRVER